MADILDTVIDIAKKLRKSAKKTDDPQIQSLITDLNLSLADLKVELVEQREAELRREHEAHEASSDNGQESQAHHEPTTALTGPVSEHRDPGY